MNISQTHLGSITADERHPTDTIEFDGEEATPFPLLGVYSKLYTATVLSDELPSTPSVLEMAVLFQNTFDEGISLSQLTEAQARVESRSADETDTTPTQAIVVEETVNAYGRDYAFTMPAYRQQYDAVKWVGFVALYEFGDALVHSFNAITDRTSSYIEALRNRNEDTSIVTFFRNQLRNSLPGIRK